ncbi:hypothetical protein COCCADRAFT_28173 [Bipolaris zeicola 26-R-13]|uniref:Uncharacterized protein n=1 Tax=Cochliobolus carbonum (strain 26-R-13) TaxID=930089 RepID=W6YI72_COCC2|nr:uncharacterized protein COCCADRAFT_28173 [Bipolaris zeicola 26-R-13]EUC31036.1 hypothetical protein COCCADRAFT_28173 [Bipolaris zeicola 26-R-13]
MSGVQVYQPCVGSLLLLLGPEGLNKKQVKTVGRTGAGRTLAAYFFQNCFVFLFLDTYLDAPDKSAVGAYVHMAQRWWVVACGDHGAWPISATDVAQGIRRCFSKNWPHGQSLQQKLTAAATQSSVEQSEL